MGSWATIYTKFGDNQIKIMTCMRFLKIKT